MRSLILVFLFFISNNLLTAQPHAPKTFVLVTNFDQLYATYDWKKSEVELTQRLGKKLADEVMAGSVETAWPDGISSLLPRQENKYMMAFYRVYYVTTIQNVIAVLGVHPEDNSHMPDNMKPGKEIFFLVGQSGVDMSQIKPSKQTAAIPTAPGNFSAQLSEITADFANKFAKITGAIHETEYDDEMVFTYDCRVELEGSSFSFLLEDEYEDKIAYHAEFPASTDFASALKNYRKVVQQVEASRLACCTLKKDAEYVNANNNQQNFRVAEQTNKADNKYANLNIVVYLNKGETFDKNGLLVNDWRPVLEVYAE